MVPNAKPNEHGALLFDQLHRKEHYTAPNPSFDLDRRLRISIHVQCKKPPSTL